MPKSEIVSPPDGLVPSEAKFRTLEPVHAKHEDPTGLAPVGESVLRLGSLATFERNFRNPWDEPTGGVEWLLSCWFRSRNVRSDGAELLAVTQAGAVAEHDPRVRAQHGDVVGDVFGIRGFCTGLHQQQRR